MKHWIFITALALSACDSGTEWSSPPYEVAWIDIDSNRSLYLSLEDGGLLGRVEPEVIAIGNNDQYVVAKQLPPGSKSALFYYIKKSDDGAKFNGSEITKGPFTEQVFEALSQELKLPEFSHEFR
jgi:hypothetical protein